MSMEQRSEPSTGEIVRTLRKCANGRDGRDCEECRYSTGDSAECLDLMNTEAADRLEAQERTIADKDAKIAELAARAEQADRERDAAVADMLKNAIYGVCFACVNNEKGLELCDTCTDDDCNFLWRGLPQEGEVL